MEFFLCKEKSFATLFAKKRKVENVPYKLDDLVKTSRKAVEAAI